MSCKPFSFFTVVINVIFYSAPDLSYRPRDNVSQLMGCTKGPLHEEHVSLRSDGTVEQMAMYFELNRERGQKSSI